MSIYFNQVGINVADIVRIEFQDNKPNNTGIENVASLTCQYDTVKLLHKALGQVIDDHDAKLAKIVDDRAKAN